MSLFTARSLLLLAGFPFGDMRAVACSSQRTRTWKTHGKGLVAGTHRAIHGMSVRRRGPCGIDRNYRYSPVIEAIDSVDRSIRTGFFESLRVVF